MCAVMISPSWTSRLSFDDPAKAAVYAGDFCDQIVQYQESCCCDGSAGERGIGASHGILDGIGKQ